MTEPEPALVLINLFSMPAEMVDGFVARWEDSIADAADAPGFRGTRLHRSLDPAAPFPVVNIARWDDAEQWRATVAQHFADPSDVPAGPASAIRAQPALYTVVHTTPDPRA